MQPLPALPSVQALRIFDAAVQKRSFSAAAQELGLTQGAVSRQIHQLEALTGAVLFHRRSGHMMPTPAALSLAARSADALRTIGNLFAQSVPHTRTRGLRLATTIPFARFWLAPRLERLFSLKGIAIASIETVPDPTPRRGRADVAIRYGRGQWPETQTQLLAYEHIIPVASPRFAMRSKEWNAAAVVREPLIANTFVPWHAWLEGAGILGTSPLNIVLETGDTGFALDAAIAGVGVALAHERLVSPLLASGELVQLATHSPNRNQAYYLVWPANTEHRRPIALLERWLKKEFDPASQLRGRARKQRAANSSLAKR